MSLALELTIFGKIFAALAEEMGIVLRRSAFSPNLKERRDYSCAVCNADGELLAQAAHIPVHLGALPRSRERLPELSARYDLDKLLTADGEQALPGKINLTLPPGSRLSIRTPGGGGWGKKEAKP